jgi:hypothetical protein
MPRCSVCPDSSNKYHSQLQVGDHAKRILETWLFHILKHGSEIEFDSHPETLLRRCVCCHV